MRNDPSPFEILVVEDSMTQALMMQDTLEKQGWKVRLASSAEQCLTLLSEGTPDLIVTDFLLPGIRGDELCRRLHLNAATRMIPIVMLTAEGHSANEVTSINSGADIYLAKPFDPEMFITRVKSLLSKNRKVPLVAGVDTDFRHSRILAIDDSVTYLEYLRVLMNEEGYVVDTVSSGEAGLQQLKLENYDCVLVDLIMPGLDGIEFCKQVLVTQSVVEDPVVLLMLTAHETKEEVTRGLAAGADDFVSKNSDVAVLKARIRALLRRKFLQTENKRFLEQLKDRELEAVRARAEQEILQTRALMIEQLEKTAADLQISNNELVKAQAIAVQASASKSEFLANMSHEIRTPINGVIGMTDLLMDLSLNPEQQDYVETIKRSADSLLSIVNDILDFSKVEAGKLDLESIDFDFRQMIDDLMKTFVVISKKQEIDLQVHLPASVDNMVKGDPGRVRQVLTNLINNAIKFTKKGSVELTIDVTNVANKQSRYRFSVTDTGLGISQETLRRLFQGFSQGDSSTSRKFGGTGLGLAICKRLVELMSGTIGVESTVGVGSIFWFEIPLERAAIASVGTKISEPRIAAMAERFVGKRVLIAEDNPVNQKVALLMLQKLGIRAQAVANGNEVLEALREIHYDLILMDCQMPELDGYEATKVIRSGTMLINRDILILAMTANALAGELEKCLGCGMNGYLVKPVRLESLAEKIDQVFSLQAAAINKEVA